MKIHFLHSSSASNRANSKVSQRIAPLQVVIVAVFNFEDPKNFCNRPEWGNAQDSEFSFR